MAPEDTRTRSIQLDASVVWLSLNQQCCGGLIGSLYGPIRCAESFDHAKARFAWVRAIMSL